MNIRFDFITPENWRIFNRLRVAKEQEEFVASNVAILARAFAFRDYNSLVYAVYNDDTPIGLLMQWEYREDDKLICVLDQFMIDKEHQRRGYGRAAMQLWLSMIEKEGKYDSITLCYKDNDESARNLYLSISFYHTGEADEDEVIMEYKLNHK